MNVNPMIVEEEPRVVPTSRDRPRAALRFPGRPDGHSGLPLRGPRIGREIRTVAAMVRIYCRDRHGKPEGLCPECRMLLDYAEERLARCRFQEGKTTCAHCPVHCYRLALRDRIREVMRYAGPRMLVEHPWLAVRHLLDGWRKRPLGWMDRGARPPS